MSTALHLVRLTVDARKLYAFARKAKVASHNFDEGYAVHALLAALFDHGTGEGERVAPKPFHCEAPLDGAVTGRPHAHFMRVLGYAGLDHEALLERAKLFGDPDAWDVCAVEDMVSKPMPATFPLGLRLGFRVRVCPVMRIAKRGPMTKDRQEVDAFLARAWEVDRDTVVDREEVYKEWLSSELTKGGAKLLDARLDNFLIRGMRRRRHAEKSGWENAKLPDATLDGVFEVEDGTKFLGLLKRGVGRHRAFGFGMLLLKPVRQD